MYAKKYADKLWGFSIKFNLPICWNWGRSLRHILLWSFVRQYQEKYNEWHITSALRIFSVNSLSNGLWELSRPKESREKKMNRKKIVVENGLEVSMVSKNSGTEGSCLKYIEDKKEFIRKWSVWNWHFKSEIFQVWYWVDEVRPHVTRSENWRY